MDEYLQDGVYTIYPARNTATTLGITASRDKKGHRWLGFTGNGDSNLEKFFVQAADDPIHWRFTVMDSNKAVDINTYSVKNGSYPIEYPITDAVGTKNWRSQTWEIQEDPIDNYVNGVQYRSYRIVNNYAPSYAWDCKGGNTSPSSWVQLYKKNSSINQRFIFIKDIFKSNSLAVPTNIGLASSKTGKRGTRVSVTNASTPIYIYWECPGTYFQISWHWRGRRVGQDKMEDSWSQWLAVADQESLNGNPEENGWGNPWVPTTTVSDGNAHHSNVPIYASIDQVTYDKKEIELCIRKFEHYGKTIHNVSHHVVSKMIYQKGLYVVYRPNLACSDLGFSPTGLIFSLTSDFKRNNNTASINSIIVNGKTLVRNFNASGLAYTGNGASIRIPVSQLSFIPNEGDTAHISVNYSTIDGTWTYNFTKQISYDANYGITLNPTFSKGEGQTEYANLNGSFTSSHCWLLVEHDGRSQFVECEKDASGRFLIIPPIGVEYRLFFSAENASGWGTKSVLRPAVKGVRYIYFNWNGGYAVLPWDSNVQWGLERDSQSVQTQSRLFESVFFGNGSKRPFTISGRLLKDDGVDHSSFEDFEKLSVCDYGVVRFPTGGRYDLAILKISFTQDHSCYREVTIDGCEVS